MGPKAQTAGGPAINVLDQTASGEREGGAALPVYAIMPGDGYSADGGPACPVYAVTDPSYPRVAGPAVPVKVVPSGSRAVGGKAIPVYCVNADEAGVLGGGVFNVPNTLRWQLNDNLADTVVVGSEVNGVMNGGNTADVVGTLANGKPGFHFNGSSQYVSVPMGRVIAQAVAHKWTKHASNPVLPLAGFPLLWKNPSGGWYAFGGQSGVQRRWSSNDLVTWGNRIDTLNPGGAGKWDKTIIGEAIFRKPDGTWMLIYRGFDDVTYRVGLATSSDGATFTRYDNGGVNDGLFARFGNNYDITAVILVGTTYYVYANGDPNHGTTNIYTCADDFETFELAASAVLNDIGGAFCPGVWTYGGYYYAMICSDFTYGASNLYDHVIGLYRSPSPLFPKTTLEFLGYPIVNDQAYDATYLDSPSMPLVDVYGSLAPGFGDTLYTLYAGGTYPGCLAWTSLSSLGSLNPCVSVWGQAKTYEFWMQLDALTTDMPIFSIGNTRNDGSCHFVTAIKASGADKVFSVNLAASWRNTSLPLAINTPYHVVITDDRVTTTVYINKNSVLSSAFRATSGHLDYLYFGSGYNGYMDGWIGGFKLYPRCLTAAEVARLK